MKPLITWILLLCLLGISLSHATSKESHNQLSYAFLSDTLNQANNSAIDMLYEDNNFNADETTDGDGPDQNDNSIPIMALEYSGHWNSTSTDISKEFGFLTQSSGVAEFTTAKNYYLDIDDFIIFTLYDGEYTDQKYIVINFIYNNLTDFSPNNSTFKNDSITFFIYLFDKYAELGQKMCTGSYQLSFLDSITGEPYQRSSNDYENVYALFQLNSSACNIAITSNVSVKSEIKPSEILGYSVATVIICVLQLWTCITMSKNILQSEPEGARISLLSLGFFIGWDVFLCLFYLYNALTISDYFHYFLAPAFVYFVLVSIFETRLILLVWKSKYYSQYQNSNQIRQGVVKFYLKFYGFFYQFLILCYFFLPSTWLFYALSPFFVPQIVHNAIRGQRYKFNKSFIFLLGLLRISLPLYARGYTNNIFRLTPDTKFIYIYTPIILAQILVLFLQSKLGSRFFVPSCFLPPKYNYFVKVTPEHSTEEDSTESCPICMEDLNTLSSDAKTPLLDVKRFKKIRLMQTPCKHQFHEPCLRGWMDLKLECPSCRTKLPPID